jgi:hypothetical protein
MAYATPAWRTPLDQSHSFRCSLWVISGHFALQSACPLFPPESGHSVVFEECPLWAIGGHLVSRASDPRAFARHRERISVCIGDVLLSICFGRCRWLRRQLKHRCLLTLT